jgi:hypothetical protein
MRIIKTFEDYSDPIPPNFGSFDFNLGQPEVGLNFVIKDGQHRGKTIKQIIDDNKYDFIKLFNSGKYNFKDEVNDYVLSTSVGRGTPGYADSKYRPGELDMGGMGDDGDSDDWYDSSPFSPYRKGKSKGPDGDSDDWYNSSPFRKS